MLRGGRRALLRIVGPGTGLALGRRRGLLLPMRGSGSGTRRGSIPSLLRIRLSRRLLGIRWLLCLGLRKPCRSGGGERPSLRKRSSLCLGKLSRRGLSGRLLLKRRLGWCERRTRVEHCSAAKTMRRRRCSGSGGGRGRHWRSGPCRSSSGLGQSVHRCQGASDRFSGAVDCGVLARRSLEHSESAPDGIQRLRSRFPESRAVGGLDTMERTHGLSHGFGNGHRIRRDTGRLQHGQASRQAFTCGSCSTRRIVHSSFSAAASLHGTIMRSDPLG